MRNKYVLGLHIVKKKRNFLHAMQRRNANRIVHTLRRNYLVKHVIEGEIEGRIEVTGRRERRCKQLLNDLKKKERVLEIESRRTRFHCVKNSHWKSLWTCRRTDCGMMNDDSPNRAKAESLLRFLDNKQLGTDTSFSTPLNE